MCPKSKMANDENVMQVREAAPSAGLPPFLRLPGELRNLVYTFVLSSRHSYQMYLTPKPKNFHGQPRNTGRAYMALIHVCHQTRKEFSSLFFDNTMIFLWNASKRDLDRFKDVFKWVCTHQFEHRYYKPMWDKSTGEILYDWVGVPMQNFGKAWKDMKYLWCDGPEGTDRHGLVNGIAPVRGLARELGS